MDEQTKLELEAAAFRRLLAHLDERKDVQNIDMMNLTGFCRNCLSRWYQEAAAEKGLDLDKEAAREVVYGMPYASGRRSIRPRRARSRKRPSRCPTPDTDRGAVSACAQRGSGGQAAFRQRRGAGRQACPAH
jgi:hypothetical protein